MTQVELLVKLKIPDTTAISTLKTLEKLKYNVKSVLRQDYYCFEVSNSIDEFGSKISKVDILVNSNKHSHVVQEKGGVIGKDPTFVFILVKSIENDCSSLLKTLQERLGLSEISSMSKGVLWTIEFEKHPGKEIIDSIGSKLLANINYQKYKVF